jgi:hypothetical protein
MMMFNTVLQWFSTPLGRTAAAAVIFALIYAAKNILGVGAWLAVGRRKVLMNIILSLAPAAVMLTDRSVPSSEAWMGALQTALGAAGLQGVLAGLLGPAVAKTVGLADVEPKPAPDPPRTEP